VSGSVRIGVGTKVLYDGDLAEVVELQPLRAGTSAVLRDRRGRMLRVSVRELLAGERARIVPEESGPASDDPGELASVVLAGLSDRDRRTMQERASHIREVLTGFRSGNPELAQDDEPRPQYDPALPLMTRYRAKAGELGVSLRTLGEWVAKFHSHGDVGLAPNGKSTSKNPFGKVDQRWIDTAAEVMAEYTKLSRPSRTSVIDRTHLRVVAKYGADVVALPSRSAAFRALQELEKRYPTFRLSTKRNRDIADRPDGAYGKLRPTRPGEYLVMDTTRLDVFALDPVTLRWVQAELTIGMDWYTRCVTGIRLTPVSTKSVDAASVLYQAYRPRPAGKDRPTHAVWPEHGIPRTVLIDVDAVEGPLIGAAGPAIVPETIVIDHGKIYVSEHLTSVCARLGISIQPARLRTGRDKPRVAYCTSSG
jgi:transposase InsO family protein